MALAFSLLSDVHGEGYGKGGLNVLRLVNKRFKQVVESCATRLSRTSLTGTKLFCFQWRNSHLVIYPSFYEAVGGSTTSSDR